MKSKITIKNKIDIHKERTVPDVIAGISDLQIMCKNGDTIIPINFSITASTSNSRGVHMSRLVSAAQKYSEEENINNIMSRIVKEVNKTQNECNVISEFEYPYEDQFMKIQIIMKDKKETEYNFTRMGITSCPCSKEISGIGHMQRTFLTIKILTNKRLNFGKIASRMNKCFSTVPKEFLNRVDESMKIISAQENSMFVEDVVRVTLKQFPEAETIKAKSLESIHTHNAIASWKKEH